MKYATCHRDSPMNFANIDVTDAEAVNNHNTKENTCIKKISEYERKAKM